MKLLQSSTHSLILYHDIQWRFVTKNLTGGSSDHHAIQDTH